MKSGYVVVTGRAGQWQAGRCNRCHGRLQ